MFLFGGADQGGTAEILFAPDESQGRFLMNRTVIERLFPDEFVF